MAKVKLNLPTGASVEKPVVTCFEVDSKKYLILDAENIGSMGLPIILVCKIENDTVKKIVDPTEWQQAKDYLKGIIAGNSMNYVSVGTEISADEVYYTQLTLPVASFDVIKNSYKVEEPVVVEQPVSAEPVVPVMEPVVPEVTPVAPVSTEPVMPEIPAVEPTPVVSIEPVSPVIPDAPIIPEAPIAPTEPVIPEVPTVDDVATAADGIDFAESKEAFMKACENMFDALVSKFQAELDKK